MNIWKILHIESTTDKRAIKKAYALRSKTIHPEEKPEEFRQLYEAYQMALQYAKYENDTEEVEIADLVSFSVLRPEPSKEESEAPSELAVFFTEQQKYREVCMRDFQKAWERIYETQGLNGEAQVWQSYLKSKEFKEIQMDSLVIRQMIRATQNMGFHTYEFCLNLWEVYDLQEEDAYQYHSELKELCKSLSPSKSRERAERKHAEKIKKEEQAKEQAKRRYFLTIFVALFFLVGTLISIVTYQKFFMTKISLKRYMAEEYPETIFSKPERQKSSDEGWDVFNLHTLEQPEIAVRARVRNGSYNGHVIEDYGAQRLQKIEEIVKPYGLNFFMTKFQGSENGLCVFNYSDLGDLEEFCRLFERFYGVEKENIRRYIDWIGFCPENIQYPENLMKGGFGVMKELWNPPIYKFSDLPEQTELLKLLQDSLLHYMYFYETYKLTPEQRERVLEYKKGADTEGR